MRIATLQLYGVLLVCLICPFCLGITQKEQAALRSLVSGDAEKMFNRDTLKDNLTLHYYIHDIAPRHGEVLFELKMWVTVSYHCDLSKHVRDIWNAKYLAKGVRANVRLHVDTVKKYSLLFTPSIISVSIDGTVTLLYHVPVEQVGCTQKYLGDGLPEMNCTCSVVNPAFRFTLHRDLRVTVSAAERLRFKNWKLSSFDATPHHELVVYANVVTLFHIEASPVARALESISRLVTLLLALSVVAHRNRVCSLTVYIGLIVLFSLDVQNEMHASGIVKNRMHGGVPYVLFASFLLVIWYWVQTIVQSKFATHRLKFSSFISLARKYMFVPQDVHTDSTGCILLIVDRAVTLVLIIFVVIVAICT